MNASFPRCILTFFLICSSHLTATLARQQEPDSSTVPHASLSDEIALIKISLETSLTENLAEIERIEQAKDFFHQRVGNLPIKIRAFRPHLQERQSFLQKHDEILAAYDPNDTLALTQSYWQYFTKNLGLAFSAEKWQYEGKIRPQRLLSEDYEELVSQYNNFISRLDPDAIHHPLLSEMVLGLINDAGANPFETKDLADGFAQTAKMREVLLQEPWGPEKYNSIKPAILSVRNIFDKAGQQLSRIEALITEFYRQEERIAAQLERRLDKIDALRSSVGRIENNLRHRKKVDSTQVRQQLAFIETQKQFIDYEHRVLKSYGEIEKAISENNWKAILAVIAGQDPDFGQLDVGKNGYVLYIGAQDRNLGLLVHEERGASSDYLLAPHSFFVIWLEDNPLEKYQINLSVQKLPSELETTLGIIRKEWKRVAKRREIAVAPTFFYYDVKKLSRVPNPAQINLTLHRLETEALALPPGGAESNEAYKAGFKVHEKSLAHFSVGLAAAFFEPPIFVTEGNTLKINSKGKRELDQHLHALFNFHLGARDIDRFSRYRVFDYRKFMLQAGVGIAKNPLDRLYVGIGYRLFKAAQIDFLYLWLSEQDRSQAVSLEGVASLEEAKKKFDKAYRGNFAIGVSFQPQLIMRLVKL